ncbi:MAG: site-2 protease family protein [Verrucomicrobiales bacterium]
MLRFTFLGFPVTVHWMFWLVTGLLGSGAAEGQANFLSATYGKQVSAFVPILFWVGLAFASILLHELGHSLAFRRFGTRSQIVLYGMGGYAQPEGGIPLTRWESIKISAAGPAVSFGIGGAAWWLHQMLHPPEALMGYTYSRMILGVLIWINLGWGILNLLPIYPLDGGQIFDAWHGRGARLTGKVGAFVAAAVAIGLFYYSGGTSFFSLIFFGFLAYQNWQRSKGAHGGGFW